MIDDVLKLRLENTLNKINSELACGELADLAMGLEYLRFVQNTTSSLTKGCIPDEIDLPSKDAIRTYFLALIVETGELIQELNWKPWKEDKQINHARVADEFADVLAFLGIIIVYLDRHGISPTILSEAYNNKTKINVSRFLGHVDGYRVNGDKDAQ